ncbi:MAG: DEAD/DEAH box helicase [Treponema sp.]|nr:DEAD/DEAH box helicase [Treponema sp.]
MEFSELKLHPDLQRGINEAGFTACMPVQEQVLSHAFGGQDLYVQSQTGTGKTAAFLIVIFQRLLSESLLAGKKAIIMVPTRELAVQVEEEARIIGKYLPFKTGSFYGGVGYTQQTKLLRENVQILVGTPGRVLDLNETGKMNLMDIAFLVIDEADRMFDMGFYPDLRRLIKVVPPADRRQTMLFSATLNSWVKNLAWEYTKSPFEIEIAPETVTVDEVDQILYHVSSQDKMKLLLGILEREKPESALIFCNTKKYAEIAAKRLRLNGYQAEFIIGDLPQPKRLKIIDDIKAGDLKYLVATDVAARGLDIEGLAMVVNYDLPNEAENYVHRIGRTARAGKTGRAISLASEQDVYELPAIERYIGKKIPSESVTSEMFGTDKSEGERIHTEFAPDDRQGRGREGGRRGGRRAQDGGRRGDTERPRRRTEKTERRKPGDGGHGAEGRADQGYSSGKRQRRGRQKFRDGNVGSGANAGSNVNLNKLSFDERMSYYKQKYNTEPGNKQKPKQKTAPEISEQRTRGSRNQKAKNQRTAGFAGRTENRNKAAAAGHAGSAGQAVNAGHTASDGQTRNTGSAGREIPQNKNNSPQPKKNIISRLLGIFGKKNSADKTE